METAKIGENAANGIQVTYFVAECMEFFRYGEYIEDIPTIKEALEYYDQIPPDRLNAGKGIGIHIHDPKEGEYTPEYQLLAWQTLDVDALQMMYGIEKYPQVMESARELAALRTDITVVDTKGLLKKVEIAVDAAELAKKINGLQRKLDRDSYDHFYPDAAAQEKKITMQILTEHGKKEYMDWLDTGHLEQFPEIGEEVGDIRRLLETADIQWPAGLSPFVYIRFSESAGVAEKDFLPIEEADPLFGRLDMERAAANREKGIGGYDKTEFIIYYQMDVERSSYRGRQDFGDGDGTLLEHIEAFARYYLETEDGRQILEEMKPEDSDQMKEDCEYIRDELIPFLKYYCNLYAIEEALKEEQSISEKIPVMTDRQAARREYQIDLEAYIAKSRRALSQGGTLPKMPDIRDYEETKGKNAYREQVMQEIEEEAKQYGMTVEEYAKKGYKLIKNR